MLLSLFSVCIACDSVPAEKIQICFEINEYSKTISYLLNRFKTDFLKLQFFLDHRATFTQTCRGSCQNFVQSCSFSHLWQSRRKLDYWKCSVCFSQADTHYLWIHLTVICSNLTLVQIGDITKALCSSAGRLQTGWWPIWHMHLCQCSRLAGMCENSLRKMFRLNKIRFP